MIDDLFNLIINKSTTIPNEFYDYLNKLDLLYTKEILEITECSKILTAPLVLRLGLQTRGRGKAWLRTRALESDCLD